MYIMQMDEYFDPYPLEKALKSRPNLPLTPHPCSLAHAKGWLVLCFADKNDINFALAIRESRRTTPKAADHPPLSSSVRGMDSG